MRLTGVRRGIACLAALALASGRIPAQPPFGVEARVVQAAVTVTDSKGRAVTDLRPEEFLLLENGRPRPITVDTFESGMAPIALVVAVQSSGVSVPALQKIDRIAGMIQPLVVGAKGCAAVVSFADTVKWEKECTDDPGEISRGLTAIRPGDPRKSRMLDAAMQAIERLGQRPHARRVLLLLSQSRDRGSETALEQVVRAAQEAGVSIYAGTYSAFWTSLTEKDGVAPPLPTGMRRSTPGREEQGAPLRRDRDPTTPPPEQRVDLLGAMIELARLGKINTTEVLTSQTGGLALSFAKQGALERIIESLGAELHQQYVLNFTPVESAAGFHPIEVRVLRQGEFKVRTRPGYWRAAAQQDR